MSSLEYIPPMLKVAHIPVSRHRTVTSVLCFSVLPLPFMAGGSIFPQLFLAKQHLHNYIDCASAVLNEQYINSPTVPMPNLTTQATFSEQKECRPRTALLLHSNKGAEKSEA